MMWQRRTSPTRWPGVKVVVESDGPVISIETCRQQLEVVAFDGVDSDGLGGTHPDDALIMGMLDAAVEAAEDFTGLSIAQRTYEMALDNYPSSGGAIELLRPPLIEILAVTDGQGSDGEVDPDAYVLDDFRSPPGLLPSIAWPSITSSTNGIRIRYRAGYSSESAPDSDAQPMPKVIRQAILLLLGHLYAHREDSVEKALSSIPNGFESLLRPRRILKGMA